MNGPAGRAASGAAGPPALVRPERPDDVAAIREVERQAFRREEEAALVDALRDAGALVLSAVAVLEAGDGAGVDGGGFDLTGGETGDGGLGTREAGSGEVVAHAVFTYVTVLPDGALVGHKAVTGRAKQGPMAVTGDLAQTGVSLLGLGPVAVLPALQGRGLGTLLIETCLERLRSEGHPAVVVVGHPGYYPRFGFLPARRWGLRMEMDVPDEAFMAIELTPGALRDVAGVVRYRPEFAGV